MSRFNQLRLGFDICIAIIIIVYWYQSLELIEKLAYDLRAAARRGFDVLHVLPRLDAHFRHQLAGGYVELVLSASAVVEIVARRNGTRVVELGHAAPIAVAVTVGTVTVGGASVRVPERRARDALRAAEPVLRRRVLVFGNRGDGLFGRVVHGAHFSELLPGRQHVRCLFRHRRYGALFGGFRRGLPEPPLVVREPPRRRRRCSARSPRVSRARRFRGQHFLHFLRGLFEQPVIYFHRELRGSKAACFHRAEGFSRANPGLAAAQHAPHRRLCRDGLRHGRRHHRPDGCDGLGHDRLWRRHRDRLELFVEEIILPIALRPGRTHR
mmetsp:Transcript_13661/g.51097  ORF Transcript_13661/g.51097 Transcript_13661/m.51097 type:complete len:325 (+) Transcript_13661:1908-2882(+)